MPSPRVEQPTNNGRNAGNSVQQTANPASNAEVIEGDCEGNETLELLQQVTYIRVSIDCINWRQQPSFASNQHTRHVGIAERGQYFIEYQIPCADKSLESLGKKTKVPSKRELSNTHVTTFGHRRVALVRMSATLYELWSRAALTFRVFYQPPRVSPRDRTGPNMLRPVGRCSIRMSDILELPFGMDVDLPLEQLTDGAADGTLKLEVQLGSRNSAFQARVQAALAHGHRRFSSSSDDLQQADARVRVAPARSHSQADLAAQRRQHGMRNQVQESTSTYAAEDKRIRQSAAGVDGRTEKYDMNWPNNPTPMQPVELVRQPPVQTAVVQTPSFAEPRHRTVQPRIDVRRRRVTENQQQRVPSRPIYSDQHERRQVDRRGSNRFIEEEVQEFVDLTEDDTPEEEVPRQRLPAPNLDARPADRRVTIADREQVFYRSASVSEEGSAERTLLADGQLDDDNQLEYDYYMPRQPQRQHRDRHRAEPQSEAMHVERDRHSPLEAVYPTHNERNQQQAPQQHLREQPQRVDRRQERRPPPQHQKSHLLRVTVHSARRLPLVKGPGGSAAFPNVFVTMRGERDDVLRSDIASQTVDPVWHWSNVLRVSDQRRDIVLKLWHRPTDGGRDRVLGFVSLDVPASTHKMPITQYYDVIDLSATGAGRVKVTMAAEPDPSIGEWRRGSGSAEGNMNLETSFAEVPPPAQPQAQVRAPHGTGGERIGGRGYHNDEIYAHHYDRDTRRDLYDERRVFDRSQLTQHHSNNTREATKPIEMAKSPPASARDDKATNTTAGLHQLLVVDTGIQSNNVPKRSPFMDDYYNAASKSFLAEKLRTNIAELDDLVHRIA